MAVEQNVIPVSVESRFIGLGDHTQVMAGNVAVDFVKITLDSEWDGLSAYVTFTGCAEEPTTVDYSTAAIEIPWEQIAEAGELFVGVQGFDATADVTIDEEGQLVTNGVIPTLNAAAMTVPIQVYASSETGGTTPQQPTQGTLQRVENDILTLEKLTEGADKTIAKVEAATAAANTAADTANAAAQTVEDAKAAATEAAASANAAASTASTAASNADTATAAANTAASTANTAASNADAATSNANTATAAANTATANAETATAAAQKVADDVEGWAASAQADAATATAKATSAATSETSAAASASAAATSETSAAASATAAAASETSAATSRDRAEKAADKAEQIVGFTIDDDPTEGSTNPVSSGGVYTALRAQLPTLEVDGHVLKMKIGG